MTLELEVLADHPRCYFPLTESGEASDDIYADATGNGYDVRVLLRAHLLSHVAGPLSGTTAPSFGLDGDGHADALRSTVTLGLPTNGVPYTVEGWVRTASPNLVGPLIAWGPVGGYPDISLDVYALRHSFEPDGPSFFVEDGAADNYGAPTTPQLFDDAWHHLVITDDGAGGKNYYRDGSLVLSASGGSGGNGLDYSSANILSLGDTGQYGDCVLGNTFGDAAMAHVAAYDTVLASERVQCHWRAGNGLPCAQWVRLSHVDGQGYWQSKGSVTEEWADGAVRVRLPFATLGATPDVLMGKDPATDLPAFCPQPTPPEQPASGSRPTPPLAGMDCTENKCGAALAMTQHLQDLYETWRTWINAGVGAVGTVSIAVILDWLGALIDGLILLERIASWVKTVFNGIRPALALLTGTEIGSVLPPWDSTTVDNVQRVFFAALQCTGTDVSVSAGDMTNVANFIRANTASFLGNIVSELLALCCEFSALTDWQTVVMGATPSGLCAGY